VSSRHSHRAAGEIPGGSEAVSSARAPAPSRGSLTPQSPPRPRGFGARLSRRQVKQTVALRQCWEHESGGEWAVKQLHRRDGLVELVSGESRRFVTFGELGRHYRLLEEAG
jgi:hypothetical protein